MPFDSVNIRTFTSIAEISGVIVSDIDMGIYTLYSSTQAASLGTAATSNHGLGTGDIIIGDNLEVDGETYFDRPFTMTEVTQASVTTPDANQDTVFFDSADGLPKYKDDGGTVHAFTEGSAVTTTNFTAGAGLTGGGTLAADRTFNVVANADASIVVNANDIQVGVLATDAQHGVRGGGTQHSAVIAAGASGFMTGADKTKLDGIATSAAALTASAPVDVTKAAAVVGVATDAARADHKHDITTATASANPPGTANAEGTATSLARSDHTHALAAFGTTTGTFAQGDDTRIVNAVQTTRTLTAGTGLTDGGDLSADRTFNVGANADGSIVANANDIQVGILATDAQHGTRGGGTIHSNAVAGGAAGFMSGSDKTKIDRAVQLLASRSTTIAIANTETVVTSASVSANTMNVGTIYRFIAGGTWTNGAASTSIFRVRIGTTTLTGNIPASLTSVNGATARTNIAFKVTAEVVVLSVGAGGTALGNIYFNLGNAVIPVISGAITAAVTVDTTATKLVELTYISGLAATTATFQTATLELVKP